MDFHAAMETFAEAWVAANTQTAVNTEGQVTKPTPIEDLPTQLPRDQLVVTKTTTPAPLPPVPPQHSPSSSSSSSSSTRSLPIHCIIEQTSGPTSFDVSPNEKTSTHTSVELDTYAILPGTTLLSECVRAALVKLGYNSSEALGAKGAIQIKNWRPLSFETITDNKSATIDDLLGELTQVSTLRIRICSATKLNSADEVKEKLLQLLLNQSHSLLANVGCSAEKGFSNGQTLATISPEMRRAFDRWYEEQLKAYTDSSSSSQPSSVNLTMAAKELLAMQQQRINMVMEAAASQRDIGRNSSVADRLKCSSPQLSPPVSRPMAASTPTEVSPSTHPALQQHFLPGKTRMRTSFDPEHEIPRLQKWFAENQHPSRELMLQYLDELNMLDSRKGRRPLDLTNIIYWFKNARAAHRRATKNSEDDSFEMEEEKELTAGSGDSLPFLPNRNAVYMVPYPQFPHLDINNHLSLLSAHSRFNGQSEYREPCDLSISKRSGLELPKSVSPQSAHSSAHQSEEKEVPRDVRDEREEHPVDMSPRHELSPAKSQPEVEQEDKSEEPVQVKLESAMDKSMDKSENLSPQLQFEKVPENLSGSQEASHDENEPKDFSLDKQKDIVVEENEKENENDNQPEDLSREKSHDKAHVMFEEKPSDLSFSRNFDRLGNYMQMQPTDLTNGHKRKYESEDDMDSDNDDDNVSLDRSSISSHDDSKIASLRESYLNAARGLKFSPVSSSPSGQPLHIPQFPHPLAMHYFPLNTHLYSQQANQMKFHNHQSHVQSSAPKSPSGPGQENNSHRKRRTRVFIDPLSEIPKLEKWFLDDTHPSSYMIDKYSEELNSSEYRQKFPKLEPKNVQLWFKNHRAKVKRMRMGEAAKKGPKVWTDKAVRCAVITLLKEMNQSALAKLSPLSQSAISNIANWKYNAVLSKEKCQKFGEWFKQYRAEINQESEHPFDTTRESRLTFHPEHEIPTLRRWFNLNHNPSDEKLYFYANELNKGCVRQERPMLTVQKLKNWWKNERQRLKRLSQNAFQKTEVEDANIDQGGSRSEKRLRSGKEINTSSESQDYDLGSYLGFSVQGTVLGQAGNQPSGFVSLLNSDADAENGNQTMLSDGRMVRAVSLLPTGRTRAEAARQGTSLPSSSQLNLVGGVAAWKQETSPRMSQDHAGATRDQSGHHWA